MTHFLPLAREEVAPYLNYFRKDGDDINLLIEEAANYYDNHFWSRPIR